MKREKKDAELLLRIQKTASQLIAQIKEALSDIVNDQDLITLVKDHDSDVHQPAVEALEKKIRKWDTQALIAAAKDPGLWEVHQVTTEALKEKKGEEVDQALETIAKDSYLWSVQDAARKVLEERKGKAQK